MPLPKSETSPRPQPRQRIFWGIRILALGLCLLSVRYAWAGLWLYRGEQALRQDRPGIAVYDLEKAEIWDAGNPYLLFLYGKAAFEQGIQTGEKAWLDGAFRRLEAVIQQMPFYGRAWLYLALAALRSEELSEDGVQRREWRSIHESFKKAYELEPGSAWMAYMTGENLLRYKHFLTEKEKDDAIQRVRQAASLLPEKFLGPSLSLIWETFGEYERLSEMTPQNFESYRELIRFLRENGLWEYLAKAFPDYLRLKEDFYQAYCREGEALLQEGSFRRALAIFQKAYWVNQTAQRAKAGVLSAWHALNQLPERYETQLEEILEDDDEWNGGILDYLGRVVYDTQVPYLKGLYAYRTGNYERAVAWLRRVRTEKKLLDRALAVSLWKTGATTEALEILKRIIAAKEPDVGDLSAALDWGSGYEAAVQAKINEVAAVSRPASAWWCKGFKGPTMHRNGRMGMIVNLRPGNVKFFLTFKHTGSVTGEPAFVMIRLNRRLLGTGAVWGKSWKLVTATARTSGGRRWLEVEWVNAREGAALRLGPVKVTMREGHSDEIGIE